MMEKEEEAPRVFQKTGRVNFGKRVLNSAGMQDG